MNQSYRNLIDSSRVSEPTRGVLLKRAKPDAADYQPVAMTEAQLTTLRSVVARVIPQSEAPDSLTIDIAARIDRMLAEGKGDGWRYADLPNDGEACRDGLQMLNEFAEKLAGCNFEQLNREAQDGLLGGITTGKISSSKFNLQRWFEDIRAIATQIYVAHPQTLARMGYSGFADDPDGFVQLGIGQVEAWEPRQR